MEDNRRDGAEKSLFLGVDAWSIYSGFPSQEGRLEDIEKVELGKRFFYVLMPGRSILIDFRKKEDQETAGKVELGKHGR